MSQKDCIAKFLGKINHNELLDTAAEFEARGQSPNDAMLSAVQDKIQELEMEQTKVVKAVREAFVKDGGKEWGSPQAKPESQEESNQTDAASSESGKDTLEQFEQA